MRCCPLSSRVDHFPHVTSAAIARFSVRTKYAVTGRTLTVRVLSTTKNGSFRPILHVAEHFLKVKGGLYSDLKVSQLIPLVQNYSQNTEGEATRLHNAKT